MKWSIIRYHFGIFWKK